jgi:hypothetical protein
MRRYSLTHDQVRDLAPDLQHALAHHRYCESERHRGGPRPAGWIELLIHEPDTRVPSLWGTCEECHRGSTRLDAILRFARAAARPALTAG